jgi:hypothetical protein
MQYAARKMLGLGCEIHIHPGFRNDSDNANKNTDSILRTGTMKYPSIPTLESDSPPAVKTATVIGQIIALVRQTAWNSYPAMYRPMWVL